MTPLLLERVGEVETWTSNRPAVRNALDTKFVAAMLEAAAKADFTEPAVVGIRGAGPSFCAGADLALLASFDAARRQTPVRTWLRSGT